VLFSNKQIASYINSKFEPVWQSVRPVPIIRIDFGNGKVMTRTLHGNIATYLCNSDGAVLDILPGIYEPRAYVAKLNQLSLLSQYISDKENVSATLRSYHQRQSAALAHNQSPLLFAAATDLRKSAAENPTKIVLFQPRDTDTTAAVITSTVPSTATEPSAPSASQSDWGLLLQDTANNETVRRQAIHQRLSELSDAHPAQLTKWLYKNVLHADLDDAYLGLGPTLFGHYPFNDDLHAATSHTQPQGSL
jgi:hypothetical protein